MRTTNAANREGDLQSALYFYLAVRAFEARPDKEEWMIRQLRYRARAQSSPITASLELEALG